MSFVVYTDTSANLTSDIIDKYGIKVVPFSYFINGVEYTHSDPRGFDGEAYYNTMRAGVMPTTSQINPQRYINYMEPALAAGDDVLYVGMSSGISGSFASSKIAAAYLMSKYPDRSVRLVDTLGASLGEGLMVIRAARLCFEGATLDEVETDIRSFRHRMYQVFTVDDLMFLKKSGRLSGVSAAIGTALGIKPLLKGNEHGKIVNFTTVRGRRRALKALADKYAALAEGADDKTIGIAHAGCPEDAGRLADMIRSMDPAAEIITVCYEPVTGAHVGPGTLALFFEGADGVRLK